MNRIDFSPVSPTERGTLAALLTESYADLLRAEPAIWEPEKTQWERFDREVFENPDTVGRCVFLTRVGGNLVGFGSYDPRPGPAAGIVGHHCIRPPYRRRGYGKRQIEEILCRFRLLGIRAALVTTTEHPFFTPAQWTYVSCGFVEVSRFAGESGIPHRVIEYRRELP